MADSSLVFVAKNWSQFVGWLLAARLFSSSGVPRASPLVARLDYSPRLGGVAPEFFRRDIFAHSNGHIDISGIGEIIAISEPHELM
ncbi:MAG: hypothetical protein ACI8PT_000983 [Gammaproteobacteria bacterium]|jgi:hypothetical protein